MTASSWQPSGVLECVINVSEGRNEQVLTKLENSCSEHLLDVHKDTHHNRSVFTIAATNIQTPARALARTALDNIDISTHSGVHPRIGAIDVVPFVPIESRESTLIDALHERDLFAEWMGLELGVPCFLYGSGISLPEIRRSAFETLMSHTGPQSRHLTAGSCAVGARGPLIAYNLWLDAPLSKAKEIAKTIRTPSLRTLGLQVGEHTQVSCNLVEPGRIGPAEAYDLVAEHSSIARAELVGLVPREVLADIPRRRQEQLDVDEERTIEARLTDLGL